MPTENDPPASPTNLGNWSDKLTVGTLVALASPLLLGLGVVLAIWYVQRGRNALAGQISTPGRRYSRRRR